MLTGLSVDHFAVDNKHRIIVFKMSYVRYTLFKENDFVGNVGTAALLHCTEDLRPLVSSL